MEEAVGTGRPMVTPVAGKRRRTSARTRERRGGGGGGGWRLGGACPCARRAGQTEASAKPQAAKAQRPEVAAVARAHARSSPRTLAVLMRASPFLRAVRQRDNKRDNKKQKQRPQGLSLLWKAKVRPRAKVSRVRSSTQIVDKPH